MNKNHVFDDLSSYFDNQLSQEEKQRVEEHLKECRLCAQEFSHLKALSEKLKDWQAPDLGPFFEQAVKERISTQGKERGGVKMKKRTLTVLVPSGVLVGILTFVVAGALIRGGFYNQQLASNRLVNEPPKTQQLAQPQQQTRPQQQTVTPQTLLRNGMSSVREADKIPLTQGSPDFRGMERKSKKEYWDLGLQQYNYTDTQRYDYVNSLGYTCGKAEGVPAGSQYYQAEEFNTEQYDRIYDNDFLQVKENPLSTFSIDVDTASYSNVRRFLTQNQMPPKDAVRIEEMINYFSYDYPQPTDNAPFSITTQVSACPWNDVHKLVLVGLQGRKIEAEKLPPSNLVFLIDVSGSMRPPNKLPLLKSAFRLLVNELRTEDRVSIVVYAGSSGLVLDSVTGDQKQKILDAIDRLEAGGSTAGGAGIQLAYEIAKKNYLKEGNNRVILATDGDFNVGVSSDADLTRIIEEKRSDGIFLTVLGFGVGNYKDAKMEKLADKGNGNLAYIDSLLEAKKIFVDQLTGTLFTIAKDVKIQVEFNPVKIKAYRLVGYENRLLKKEDFNDDKKDAGEIGAGHSVTALYEIVPVDSAEQFAGADDLKYQQVTVRPSDDLLTVKLRYKEPKEDASKLIVKAITGREKESNVSENLNFASAVAEFAMILRDSPYKAKASYQSVVERAKASKGKDADGYRSEFIKLAEMAQMLDIKNK